MIYIYNTSRDPYFNLAAEEYLLENIGGEIFMLWVNDEAVIVGRNQNTLSEIDSEYIARENIAVVRRLTGGGAVYHDPQNLNFTFIRPSAGGGIDFVAFAEPVIGALAGLGVKAELSGRNDLLIEGKKFSGNAQCTYKNRTLHHGTLMLNTRIDRLSKALRADREKIESKGVRSIEARVTNINEHLAQPLSVSGLVSAIAGHMKRVFPRMIEYTLSAADISGIEKLATEKYRTWNWNYGQSPKYNFSKRTRLPSGLIDARLLVEGGVIVFARLYGDYFGQHDVREFEKSLEGVCHSPEALSALLQRTELARYFMGAQKKEILAALY